MFRRKRFIVKRFYLLIFPVSWSVFFFITSTENVATLRKYEYVKPSRRSPHSYLKTDSFPKSKLISLNEEIRQKLIHSYGKNFVTSATYQHIINQCREENSRRGTVHFYDNSKYILNPWHVCEAGIDVLIAVHIRAHHKKERNIIRRTYGSKTHVFGWKMKTVFILGSMNDTNIQRDIEREYLKYGDIVQRNFIDSYRNMTRKHLSVYDWMLHFCSTAKYLVRVDEDVFVNVFEIVKYLKAYQPESYYCHVFAGERPHRTISKWMVTPEEYDGEFYPNYCEGYGYILRSSHIKDLYWCSVYSKFFWIDDVHVTGTLPQRLKIKHQNRFWFSGYLMTTMKYVDLKLIKYFVFIFESSPNTFKGLWDACLRTASVLAQ